MSQEKKYKKMEVKTYDNEAYVIIGEKQDYLNFVTRSSTAAQRKKFMIGDILINAAVCKKCGEYIRSTHVHDFRYCKCGNVAVDGGSWYAKRLYKEEDSYYNIIEYFYDAKKV